MSKINLAIFATVSVVSVIFVAGCKWYASRVEDQEAKVTNEDKVHYVYEFEISQEVVDCFAGSTCIGISYPRYIKAMTGAYLTVLVQPDSRFKMCALQGTKSAIDAALALIRQKLPERNDCVFSLLNMYRTEM